jgi:uncharacterized membrane protein YsdA (DUF1294 family)
MFPAVAAYLTLINAAAFAAFAVDKRRAEQGAWRIPERTLLQLALLGGTSGAIAAQQLLRHKTRKQPFATQLALIAVAQAVGLAYLLWAARP